MKLSSKLVEVFSTTKFVAFDFDGVFTDNLVYTAEDGTETVSCWRSDGLGLARLKQMDIPIWVISTEKNPVVAKRCEKLGINCIQGCDDKLAALRAVVKEEGHHELDDVIFVGNDVNDLECLKAVGLAVVVSDCHPDVVSVADYITERPGGRGAVREVCDIVLSSKCA